MSGARAAELVGDDLTYRQLDYWARCGYVRPAGAGRSGMVRTFDELEARIVRVMARLVSAGVSVPVSAEIAREAVEAGDPTWYAHLGDGLYLVVVVELDGARPDLEAVEVAV